MYTAMPDPNSRPSTGNRGQAERVVQYQPEKVGSRVRAEKTVVAEGGGLDRNQEVREKVTEERSRFLKNADCTRKNSQHIVQYQRAEALGHYVTNNPRLGPTH